MGSPGAIIFIGAIVALAVVVWGAFRSRRSIAIAVVAVFVAVLAAGCGWYAFAESRSIPWTIGYGVVALLSAGVAMKNVIGSRGSVESSFRD
jgi:cytochrome bd-type quinol oxidase subunit 1